MKTIIPSRRSFLHHVGALVAGIAVTPFLIFTKDQGVNHAS
jgi:hypothetical protein